MDSLSTPSGERLRLTAAAGPQRSPRSPSPRFGLVLGSRFWSCALARPTSSDSLNWPSLSRRTYLLSVPVSINSRGITKHSLKNRLIPNASLRARLLVTLDVDEGGVSENAEDHGDQECQSDSPV